MSGSADGRALQRIDRKNQHIFYNVYDFIEDQWLELSPDRQRAGDGGLEGGRDRAWFWHQGQESERVGAISV